MFFKNIFLHLLTALLLLFWMVSCGVSDSAETDTESSVDFISIPESYPYQVDGGNILLNNKPFLRNGVNAMNIFGPENPEEMASWNVGIVREFIGNLREQPVTGGPVKASDGAWLHPLQTIAERNRSQNLVTILSPFGWVDNSGEQILLTGLNPSDQPFYNSYKTKLREIAEHFKNQPDVWIHLWNEPYHYNNENGYTDERWLSDHIDMVNNLRSVDGFYNIIVVQGNGQGQSEQAILNKGSELLAVQDNIVFDLHAYEQWLNGTTINVIRSRISALKNNGFAIIFGEVGVVNSTELMPVEPFLDAVFQEEIPTLGWLWVRNPDYQNALLDENGNPNNRNNNHWGGRFKSFLSR